MVYNVDISNAKLYVLTGTAELYRVVPVWQDFIIEERTGITSSSTDDSPVVSTEYYNLTGQKVTNAQQGQAYIVKELHQSGQTTVRKIVVSGQW
jgi:hypothetical protein